MPTDPKDPTALPTTPSREMRVIREMGLVIEPTMSLDGILTTIVEKTTRLMDAERSTLFLLDGNKELVSRILQGGGIHEIRLPMGQGIAGWCAQRGLSVCVNNAHADERFDTQWDAQFQFHTREVICHPIVDPCGVTIGAVEVLNKTSSDGFDSADLEILSIIADQIFLILENAKLMLDLVEKNRDLQEARQHLDRKNKEVILLLDLERCVANAVDLESLCNGVLQQTKQVASAESAVLYLEDEAGAEMRWIADENPVMKSVRCDERQGLLHFTASTGEPIRSTCPETEPQFSRKQQALIGRPLRHFTALPLRTAYADTVRGALAVQNKLFGEGFDDGDFFFIKLIAERLGQAVDDFRRRESQERDRRLATVGRLMAGVLHDIRSPMSVISGYAELLGRCGPGPESDTYLDRMNAAVRRITAMAEEIIAFSRGEREMLFTKVSLANMLEAFLEDISPWLEKRGVLATLQLKTAGTIVIDHDKLLRVFHNIVTNAAEAMTGTGTICIEADRGDGGTIFRFTDNGPGIPERIRGSVFQSFVTEGKKQGTGLGLAVAKEIVEAHGGTIRFNTEIGRGTTFIIEIPDRKDL